MKKRIIVLLLVSILLFGCNKKEKVSGITNIETNNTVINETIVDFEVTNVEELLLKAMNSEIKFIEGPSNSGIYEDFKNNGNEVLFKDYELFEYDYAIPNEYVFIDLDGDNLNELVVLTNSDYGAYVILKYYKESEKIYGYKIGIREFENLKIDGTFIGSSGAMATSYLKIEFNNFELQMIEMAYSDYDNNEYLINNKTVSKEEIDKFVDEWDKKENIKWRKI